MKKLLERIGHLKEGLQQKIRQLEYNVERNHTVDDERRTLFCPLQNLLNETYTYKESYTEPDNQDQAADDKDIVLDDVDHLKESTTVIDTNVETVEGVSEIVADGEMKINSDAHQVKNLHKQASDGGFSTDVAHSSGGFDEVMTVDSAKTILDGSSAAGDSGAFAIVAPESSNADSTSREGITGGSSTRRTVPSQIVSDELVSDYRVCAWRRFLLKVLE